MPEAASHSPRPAQPPAPALVQRIAFGSCAEQDKPQPILDAALREHPDLFIYLGDNIYGDTEDMRRLARAYADLGAKPEFQRLWQGTHVLATWDDHDYGTNDAGRHYPFKAESKALFLDFWQEPAASPRRQHEGIYHSLLFGPTDRRVQVILLDTRTFRDDLLPKQGKGYWKYDYSPNPSPDSTFLGDTQWAWLEEQLRVPAAFRIMASSNQFCHTYNGWESWTNVPHERAHMLEVIRKTRAEGIVFISGDVHWGELSVLKEEGLYPLYDLTSSGITESWHKTAANDNRVAGPQPQNNFGLLSIDWQADPVLTMELKTVDGKNSISHSVRRSELRFAE